MECVVDYKKYKEEFCADCTFFVECKRTNIEILECILKLERLIEEVKNDKRVLH